MSARLVLIAAYCNGMGVGKDGNIPWHLPVDLARLRTLTLGGTVCYGRRTQTSLPEGFLRGRYNLLLTTRGRELPQDFDPEGSICRSVAEALEVVEEQKLGPLFVLGGYEAWNEAISMAENGVPAIAYITRVEGDFDCDTFFPCKRGRWTRVMQGPLQLGPPPSRLELWSNF